MEHPVKPNIATIAKQKEEEMIASRYEAFLPKNKRIDAILEIDFFILFEDTQPTFEKSLNVFRNLRGINFSLKIDIFCDVIILYSID